jgi:ParB-like chromosome segregation protein Spo0J
MRVKTVPLSTLKEDPQNARVHPDRNMAAIVESLKAFGQVEPLVVREGSDIVIGGNGRLVAMRQLGWEKAKVVVVDVDDAKASALAIALNRTAELAEWDEQKLSELLSAITEDSLLAATGFDDKELRKLVANVNMEDFAKDTPAEDALPEAPPGPSTGMSGDGFWFYVEYYGQEDRFDALKRRLESIMTNKHEIDPDAFERMVCDYAEANGWT